MTGTGGWLSPYRYPNRVSGGTACEDDRHWQGRETQAPMSVFCFRGAFGWRTASKEVS